MSLNKALLADVAKKMSKPTKPKVPRNQWQHPGEITNIPGNNITMQGVGFPVLGVPNVGQPQMMYPEQDYHFPGAGNVMEYPMMAGGGYVVTRSSDRKGKTHKVTGPDGTVKYFGDSSMGQHPKDPERKAAFYARHKKNLDGNPYFRAFARETWEDGGQTLGSGLLSKTVHCKGCGHSWKSTDGGADPLTCHNCGYVNDHMQQGGEMSEYAGGGEMIRRADGSYSKRGLWDNIRANRGSGKKPTPEMLEQERKIKAEFGMELLFAQKGGEKGKKSIRDKNGYINIAKHFPEVGDNTIDEDWLAKADELNKLYPNSRFECTAKGCAEIATNVGRARGYEFGRNNAWQLGNDNPVEWTNPAYANSIGKGILPDPTTYGVPSAVLNLEQGKLVGLNRANNALTNSGKKGKPGRQTYAMEKAFANDSYDYASMLLYPGSRGYEHIGFADGNGVLIHGTGAGSGHPAYMVYDNMSNGIKLNGIGQYAPVEAIGEPGMLQKGANFMKNLFQKGGSIYDYMSARGLNGSYSNRKKMFDQYFNGNYTGTADQNMKMMQMLESQQQRFQQQRPNLAFPTPGVQAAMPVRGAAPAPQGKPTPKGMQRVTNKIDNRNWFERTIGMNEDEVKSVDFDLPQDVASFYNQYHDTNKGKKFGIVSKQNSRGYFFDENGNLALQDEVGLGSDKGDAQPVFYKVKTTPSGEYTVKKTNKIGKTTDLASAYGSNNFFTMEHNDPNKRLLPDPKDPNRAVSAALHGVPVGLEKQRLPLFGDKNIDNNRMSAGCINCRKQTLDNPYFTNIPQNAGMSLYVTPDKKNGGSTFSGNAWYKQGGQSQDDRDMVNGIADILSQVQDPQNRAQIAANMMQDFKQQEVAYNPTQFMQMAGLEQMQIGGFPHSPFYVDPFQAQQRQAAQPQVIADGANPDEVKELVHYLDLSGIDYRKPSRKKMAQYLGIQGYDFSAQKNQEMMAKVKQYESNPKNKNLGAMFPAAPYPLAYAMGGMPCFECGGSMKMGGQPQVGDEMEVTPQQMAELKKQGYTFDVL